jgi:hypothetical protein
MKDRDTAPSKNPARAAREKRLAEALRANLRRRKAAARAEPSEPVAGAPEGAPETPPGSGKEQDRRR